jgi:hypothetical protein
VECPVCIARLRLVCALSANGHTSYIVYNRSSILKSPNACGLENMDSNLEWYHTLLICGVTMHTRMHTPPLITSVSDLIPTETFMSYLDCLLQCQAYRGRLSLGSKFTRSRLKVDSDADWRASVNGAIDYVTGIGNTLSTQCFARASVPRYTCSAARLAPGGDIPHYACLALSHRGLGTPFFLPSPRC